ncbi:hypothetical protein QC761_400710 [Podospora bellae-mahoneyi]|uniref:Uncharacterized protein n=1 Tax=Podospora bellae-mahoneyi TaxID=2093777 RepID=A0ABR0FH82_9PEZI|nr:hypothetical protein QC761_400710 [Podospora bellae-mahoneyi]
MGVIRLRHGIFVKAGLANNESDGCGRRGTLCQQPQHLHDETILSRHAIQRVYQNQTSASPLTATTPALPVESTQITRETNALFTTNGVTIAVGLDAIFGLALVIFLSGVIYQWKRAQRLRAEQEERDGVTDGVEVTPAVSVSTVSKESSQLSSQISDARVKVVEEQRGDEKGGSSKDQMK